MRCIGLFAVLIAIAVSPYAMAQGQAVAPTATVEDLQKALDTSKKEAGQFREVATKLKEQNEELRKRVEGKEGDLWTRYYKAKESEYDFQIEMMNINSRSFYHQTFASYVILGLVVIVVAGGLFFAHVQLMAGLKPMEALASGVGAVTNAAPSDGRVPPPDPPLAGAPSPPQNRPLENRLGTTTVAAEVGKVTVTSSIVGVVVLVISLAFLYIYTREVYHIQVVDPFRPTLKDPVQAEPAKGATKQ